MAPHLPISPEERAGGLASNILISATLFGGAEILTAEVGASAEVQAADWVENGAGSTVPKHIETPYGAACQSQSEAAAVARSEISQGAWIYRGGKLGRSAGPEAQFWSLENPLSPGYAEKYGIPIENTNFDFVEVAVLRSDSTFITREAPGVGLNDGGGIEVVVNAGEPKLQYFHMPWELEYDSVEQSVIPRNQ